jgi:di/tricarboxylate transporter
MLLLGRWLLPEREGGDDQANRFRLDAYFTELTVLPDSPFLDQTVAEVEANDRYPFKVVGWLRNRRSMSRPFNEQRLRENDVLLIRTSPEAMVAIRQESGVELHPIQKYGEPQSQTADSEAEDIADLLVQAVLAPMSDLAGRTIGEVDFRQRYGAIVIGLWRKRGWLQQELSRTRLRSGDVLVLQGDEEALNRVANDRAFLMMVPFQGETRLRRKAPLAGVIMLATVLIAAFNLMTIEMATLAGAVAMVLTGCITPRQAYRAIDARIYVFIAGAVPLGLAMQKSGASELLAGWLQGVVGGWSETGILLLIFAIVAVLTQFMSDAATTAVFAPVAALLAQTLGHPPEPYVVTVAMAAVASFLTPIGHHGNLLVYGPGRYRFMDFVWVGTPLTILVALVVVFLAPWLWPS